MERNIYKIGKELFITNDEEIKEGDWIFNEEREPSVLQCIGQGSLRGWNKIILTTDQDLIKNGVQAIDNEFLEWFVKNLSCEEVEIEEVYPLICCIQKEGKTKMNNGCMERNRCLNYKIIIPKEEPKQETVGKQFYETADMVISETLIQAAERYVNNEIGDRGDDNDVLMCYIDFIAGAKWQAERMYSEKDMRLAINKARDISDGKDCFDAEDISGCTEVCTYGWKFNMSEDSIIEQFKKK